MSARFLTVRQTYKDNIREKSNRMDFVPVNWDPDNPQNPFRKFRISLFYQVYLRRHFFVHQNSFFQKTLKYKEQKELNNANFVLIHVASSLMRLMFLRSLKLLFSQTETLVEIKRKGYRGNQVF